MAASVVKKQIIDIFGVVNFGRIRYAAYSVEVAVNLLVGERRYCNVCEYDGRFRAFGHPPRYGAQCPRCLSLERQRLLKLWLTTGGVTMTGKTVLHFAPEPSVANILRQSAGKYISADLNPDHADLCLNIEEIDLPDNSVDVAIVSHVLEHVDDRKALAELYRIIKPGGFVAVMVPIVEGWSKSYENPSIVSHKDRIRHFGQWDHVRFYGHDLRDRIMSAGFRLEEFTAVEPEIQTLGLMRGEKVFVALR